MCWTPLVAVKLWEMEVDVEIFLDVSGGVHHAGVDTGLYLPVWVLHTRVVQHDWHEQREVWMLLRYLSFFDLSNLYFCCTVSYSEHHNKKKNGFVKSPLCVIICAGWKISVWRSSPFLLFSHGSSFPHLSFWCVSCICTTFTSASYSSPTSSLWPTNRRAPSLGTEVDSDTMTHI